MSLRTYAEDGCHYSSTIKVTRHDECYGSERLDQRFTNCGGPRGWALLVMWGGASSTSAIFISNEICLQGNYIF
jgi:hypothetical protein